MDAVRGVRAAYGCHALAASADLSCPSAGLPGRCLLDRQGNEVRSPGRSAQRMDPRAERGQSSEREELADGVSYRFSGHSETAFLGQAIHEGGIPVEHVALGTDVKDSFVIHTYGE